MKWALPATLLLAAGGAGVLSQATFRATGTGATDRSAMAKMRDVISVKDFGAVGDGSTDDTAAIQAAINSTGSTADRQHTVEIPEGTYKVTSTLSVPEGVALVGAGAWKSKLEFGSYTGTEILFVNGGTYDYPPILKDFAIHGNGVAINTAATSGAHIENIWFSSATGIQIPGTADLVIRNNFFDYGSVGIDVTATTEANNILISDNHFIGMAYGIQFKNVRDLRIIGNAFRGDTATLMHILSISASNTSKNVLISANTFYMATPPSTSVAVKLLGTLTGVQFLNNLIDGSQAEGILSDSGTLTGIVIADNQFKNTTGNTISISSTADQVAIRNNLFLSGINKAALYWRSTGAATFSGNDIWHANGVAGVGLNGAAVDVDNASLFVARNNTISTAVPTYGFLIRSSVTLSDTNFNYVSGPSVGNVGLFNTGWVGADFEGKIVPLRVVLAYSATIATDARTGNAFSITATNGTAFTVSNPSNLSTGQRVLYTIRNTSGGALGVITWGATFKMPAWTSPATANSRSAEFIYDGTNLVELWQSAADVPN